MYANIFGRGVAVLEVVRYYRVNRSEWCADVVLAGDVTVYGIDLRDMNTSGRG